MAAKMVMASAKKPPTMKMFEQSSFDKEKKGVKEGSPADKKRDKKQFAKMKAKK